jgi:hypothetical protein
MSIDGTMTDVVRRSSTDWLAAHLRSSWPQLKFVQQVVAQLP